jgi:hypothetical protein
MRSAVLIFAALGLSASVAFAADQPSNSGARGACKADAEKLCPGVERGHGRIAACLRQNEAQVSAACKDAMAKAAQKKSSSGSSLPQGLPQGSPQK